MVIQFSIFNTTASKFRGDRLFGQLLIDDSASIHQRMKRAKTYLVSGLWLLKYGVYYSRRSRKTVADVYDANLGER